MQQGPEKGDGENIPQKLVQSEISCTALQKG